MRSFTYTHGANAGSQATEVIVANRWVEKKNPIGGNNLSDIRFYDASNILIRAADIGTLVTQLSPMP